MTTVVLKSTKTQLNEDGIAAVKPDDNRFSNSGDDSRHVDTDIGKAQSDDAGCARSIEFYCFDCRTAVYDHSVVHLHQDHRCSDVRETYAEFRHLDDSDRLLRRELDESVAKFSAILEEIQTQRTRFIDTMKTVERAVRKRAEQMKRLVDEEKESILRDMETTRSDRIKAIDSVLAAIERRMSSLAVAGGLRTLTPKHGTHCDIARETDDVIERTLKELGSVEVKFTACAKQKVGLVGTVVVKTTGNGVDKSPTMTCAVARGNPVDGVTSLGGQLFVVRRPSRRQLEIYDVESSCALRCTLSVPGLSEDTMCRLAACRVNSCVYLSDYDRDVIFRLKLEQQPTPHNYKADATASTTTTTTTSSSSNSGSGSVAKVTSWNVLRRRPSGLSVNASCNVLVTCNATPPCLQEYTGRGALVRTIALPADVSSPQHAVELPGSAAVAGRYVVSHGFGTSPLHRVCIVVGCGVEDVVAVCHGGRSGSAVGRQLNNPGQLAVDRRGRRVFVADQSNNRVSMLDDRTLTWSRDLPTTTMMTSCRMNLPLALCIDETGDRLYVGEWGDGRVLVFDGLANL